MGLRINTNVASLSAQRNLNNSSIEQGRSFQRLASGQRITRAGDDAAGLSISESLRAQVRSLAQAERNANDGLSFVQVAEGGMTEVGNILVRLRELSIQASSDTISDKERGFIDAEVQSLTQEINRIAAVTNFNGTPLLSGAAQKAELEFQVGTRNSPEDRIFFDTEQFDMTASSIGIDGITFSTIDDARDAMDQLDMALDSVFSARALLGAYQNKLGSAVNTIQIYKENLSEAKSRIADTDFAAETAKLIQSNILQNAGISVLSQANANPMNAMKLL